jgi:phosphonoacetate hydrolase
LTADHAVNHKSHCWDLAKACRNRGAPVRVAISAERDRYLQHHQGFGGTSWLYLDHPRDADRVAAVLSSLPGVEQVLSRTEAARQYRLMPDRIGDLAAFANRDTVFGDLDVEREALPPTYRSHGSRYESEVPLFVYNAQAAPRRDFFENNLDVARWLYV